MGDIVIALKNLVLQQLEDTKSAVKKMEHILENDIHAIKVKLEKSLFEKEVAVKPKRRADDEDRAKEDAQKANERNAIPIISLQQQIFNQTNTPSKTDTKTQPETDVGNHYTRIEHDQRERAEIEKVRVPPQPPKTTIPQNVQGEPKQYPSLSTTYEGYKFNITLPDTYKDSLKIKNNQDSIIQKINSVVENATHKIEHYIDNKDPQKTDYLNNVAITASRPDQNGVGTVKFEVNLDDKFGKNNNSVPSAIINDNAGKKIVYDSNNNKVTMYIDNVQLLPKPSQSDAILNNVGRTQDSLPEIITAPQMKNWPIDTLERSRIISNGNMFEVAPNIIEIAKIEAQKANQSISRSQQNITPITVPNSAVDDVKIHYPVDLTADLQRKQAAGARLNAPIETKKDAMSNDALSNSNFKTNSTARRSSQIANQDAAVTEDSGLLSRSILKKQAFPENPITFGAQKINAKTNGIETNDIANATKKTGKTSQLELQDAQVKKYTNPNFSINSESLKSYKVASNGNFVLQPIDNEISVKSTKGQVKASFIGNNAELGAARVRGQIDASAMRNEPLVSLGIDGKLLNKNTQNNPAISSLIAAKNASEIMQNTSLQANTKINMVLETGTKLNKQTIELANLPGQNLLAQKNEYADKAAQVIAGMARKAVGITTQDDSSILAMQMRKANASMQDSAHKWDINLKEDMKKPVSLPVGSRRTQDKSKFISAAGTIEKRNAQIGKLNASATSPLTNRVAMNSDAPQVLVMDKNGMINTGLLAQLVAEKDKEKRAVMAIAEKDMNRKRKVAKGKTEDQDEDTVEATHTFEAPEATKEMERHDEDGHAVVYKTIASITGIMHISAQEGASQTKIIQKLGVTGASTVSTSDEMWQDLTTQLSITTHGIRQSRGSSTGDVREITGDIQKAAPRFELKGLKEPAPRFTFSGNMHAAPAFIFQERQKQRA